ncbi:Ran GTPase-activating protein 1 [Sphaceloma murrayae]|uniref:Ran GTPase-activating protein 1 n=1 Tax=Sphaceloma murrayae TaxID=2082308 RepID=A0A2K1QR37_9PEZI|nr:Ran GTPase-activating protein 1 [Sphaceloma murrayae]
MSKIFSLEGKGLKLDTASDIEPHLQPLKDSSDVEEVRLQGNTLGIEACAALASVLSTKKSLRIANLADIFTSRLLSEIPPSLTSLLQACLSLPNLHTIDLSDNAFGLNTVEPLRPFLSQHVPLQHLILNNNGLGPAAGTLVAEALTLLAEKKAQARAEGRDVPDLETVVCGRNRLENGSMKAWAAAYTANSGVKEVRMTQDGIRQEGIVVLLREGLANCKGLETLDLQDNTFTKMGSAALAEVASGGAWVAMRELGLGDCLLSARGAVQIAKGLTTGNMKGLEVLRVQFNEFRKETLKLLAEGLGELPRLRRVEVNGNQFEEKDESLEKIREVLGSRREEAGEEEGEMWGIDELEDLEDEDSDEDDETEDEEDEEEEKILKEADAAEDEPAAAGEDKEVDELAAKLGKTGI